MHGMQGLLCDHVKFDGDHHFLVKFDGGLVRAEFLDGVVRKVNLLALDVVASALEGVGQLDRVDGSEDLSAFAGLGAESLRFKPSSLDAMPSAASLALAAL